MPGKKMKQDFVMTLSDDDMVSDAESDIAESQSNTEQNRSMKQEKKSLKRKRQASDKNSEFRNDFVFENAAQDSFGDTGLDVVDSSTKKTVDLDAIIRRRKSADIGTKGNNVAESADVESSDQEASSDQSESGQSEDPGETTANGGLSESESEDEPGETAEEKRRKAEYFEAAPEPQVQAPSKAFLSMNISRPILKALTAMKFATPTPIQAKAIPVALLGKDIVGGAVTGSGKTAAFMVPILERLLYRPRKNPVTRVLILCPTRELAAQCHSVTKNLSMYTDIVSCLCVGGLSIKSQEAELRQNPDIVIATPGRFIDHVRNSQGVFVDGIEIMVMDEADRMLEEGFTDEINEIVSLCPRSRQTMLFSATMTDKVDDLIRLSLQKPVRLLVDAKKSTAHNLRQEFIRIRPQREGLRPAMLLNLCMKHFHDRVIIFFRSKAFAHKMRIIFALMGLSAGELHGSLTQEQRMQSLQDFKNGTVHFLLATDLASRGLDIKGIETVINFEMPQTFEIYLHRVGRTARAGRNGRAVTFATEKDRKIAKEAVRNAEKQGNKVAGRHQDMQEIDELQKRLDGLSDEIEEIMAEEREEKQMQQAEMELQKSQNLITHADEIKSRPARTWFTTQDQKSKAKQHAKELLNPPKNPKAKSENQVHAYKKTKADRMSKSGSAKADQLAKRKAQKSGGKRKKKN